MGCARIHLLKPEVDLQKHILLIESILKWIIAASPKLDPTPPNPASFHAI